MLLFLFFLCEWFGWYDAHIYALGGLSLGLFVRRKFVLDVSLFLLRRLLLDPLLMHLMLSASVARRLKFRENLGLFSLIYLFLPMIY